MSCTKCQSHRCFRRLADEKRVALLTYLQDRDANVTELTKHLRVTQPTVSHHLKVLHDYGFVTSKKEGRETTYSFNTEYPCKKCGVIRL